MRYPRAWRITMWTSLAATVLLAGGAIGSRGWMGVWVGGGGWLVGMRGGALYGGRLEDLGVAGTGWRNGAFRGAETRTWGWYGSPSFIKDWTLSVSLWLPAGGTCAVCALSAFMAYRTRRRPGQCPKCGYERSGLPTVAPCPECGHTRR